MIRLVRLSLFVVAVSICCLPVFAESSDEVNSGIRAFNSGNYKKAIQILGGALSTHFNNAKVHYYLANAYAKSGKNEAAVREYRIAHALDPESEVGKFSKQALDHLTDDFKKDAPPETAALPKPPPPPSAKERQLSKTLSSLDKQASRAASHNSQLSQQRQGSNSRLADDVVNRTKIEMLKDMAGRMKNPRLTREHRRQLEQLRRMYQERDSNQARSGYRKVSEIHRSSENLKYLLQSEKDATGHHLKSRGTNLYVRNYGSGQD